MTDNDLSSDSLSLITVKNILVEMTVHISPSLCGSRQYDDTIVLTTSYPVLLIECDRAIGMIEQTIMS